MKDNVWKEFDLMWGLAPPESLKYKKAREVIAFIRKHFVERNKIEISKCPRCGSDSIMHVQNH